MRSTLAQPLPTVGTVSKPVPNPYAFVPVIQSNPPRLCALVAPSIILLDVHYIPPIGTPVVVTINSQTQVVAHVTGEHSRPGPDLVLMSLDTNPGATPVPVASWDEILKAPELIVTGVTGIGSSNVPSIVSGIKIRNSLPSSGQLSFPQTISCTLENGDSGCPVFVNVAGFVKLVGTAYAILPTQVIVHVSAPYIPQISALN